MRFSRCLLIAARGTGLGMKRSKLDHDFIPKDASSAGRYNCMRADNTMTNTNGSTLDRMIAMLHKQSADRKAAAEAPRVIDYPFLIAMKKLVDAHEKAEAAKKKK